MHIKKNIYNLRQNLSLNVNSINEEEETSLYCRKIRASLTEERMSILKERDIKIK